MSRLEFNLFMLLHLPIFLVALISNSAMAQPLHTFKNGEVADAEKINENFDTIYELAGGDRGTITISTESVATANPHPVTVHFEAPVGIFYWNVTATDFYGSDNHFIEQATNYTEERGVRIPLGTGATVSAHLLDMNGRPTVASKYVSAETSIVFGKYVWESGAEAPIFEDSPVDSFGNPLCVSNQLGDSEFFFGEFCYEGNCYCSDLHLRNIGLGLPPPIDETEAIACIGNSYGNTGLGNSGKNAPLFSLNDLSFSKYISMRYGGGSNYSYSTFSYTTYQFQPAPNPSVQVDQTDYCRVIIDGDTQIYSASSSYSGTYIED